MVILITSKKHLRVGKVDRGIIVTLSQKILKRGRIKIQKKIIHYSLVSHFTDFVIEYIHKLI